MKSRPFVLGTAAAVLFVAGVYAMIGTAGNNRGNVATVENSAQRSADCALSAERGKVLDRVAVGEVANFRTLDKPVDLKSIAFLDENGSRKTLADWLGKTLVFNLWATWCPPCREEMPFLEELEAKHGGEDFAVVPVSIDAGDARKPKSFYSDAGLEALPFLHDNTMEAFQVLKENAVAFGMPTTLLVDTNGCGLGVLNGPANWSGPDAIALVNTALALPDIK